MITLTLVSHHLCPYVQRVAIALAERKSHFERINVDLSDKPDWFRALSPLGKVPLLKVGQDGRDEVIFESVVILEYLEETQTRTLHPADPLERARHRSWIEFSSEILNGIARFYNAMTREDLYKAAANLDDMFGRVEAELCEGRWFAGDEFSLVDAAYGPIFRYFDVIDRIGDFSILNAKPKVGMWRARLAKRPSVRNAVDLDYPDRLMAFLRNRKSALSKSIPLVL